MSFWTTSTGEQATGNVVETGGFDPIPKGDHLSMFEEVTVREWEGNKSIQFKTRIVGEPYNNRLMFLTLKPWDEKPGPRDRAIQILAKLYSMFGLPMPEGEPDDVALSRLTDKPVVVKVDVWETDDKQKSGNWMVNVKPHGEQGAAPAATTKPTKPKSGGPKPAAVAAPKAPELGDDGIPF